MALRLSEQRRRLVPAPPAPAGEPAAAPRDDDGRAGEYGAPPSGQPPAGDPGDFYADAMETV